MNNNDAKEILWGLHRPNYTHVATMTHNARLPRSTLSLFRPNYGVGFDLDCTKFSNAVFLDCRHRQLIEGGR